MGEQKVFDFPSEEIDVRWDGRLCIHVGECGQSEGDLFGYGREPWCLPDRAGAEEVAEVCERCPSGALTYTSKSGDQEQASPANTAQIAYYGPLYVKGDLEIESPPDDMVGVRYHAALYRCGQSKNKLFCDGSHKATDFRSD